MTGINPWYSKISKDISLIPDALQYYEDELVEAKKEVQSWQRRKGGGISNVLDLLNIFPNVTRT